MITRTDLNDRVREWSLRDDVVEKDYVIGWVLWGIGSDPQLSGGTFLSAPLANFPPPLTENGSFAVIRAQSSG